MSQGFQTTYDALCDREDWIAARALLMRELRQDPENHWLLAEVSTTYYEQRKYRTALRWAERALHDSPRCPHVLWVYAGAVDMLGQERKAITLWKKLLQRGASAIAT